MELWSLLHTLFPDIFESSQPFEDIFDQDKNTEFPHHRPKEPSDNSSDNDLYLQRPSNENGEKAGLIPDSGISNQTHHQNNGQKKSVLLLNTAHTLLESLMIRRLKRDLDEVKLPPKIELSIPVPLSPMQRFWVGFFCFSPDSHLIILLLIPPPNSNLYTIIHPLIR